MVVGRRREPSPATAKAGNHGASAGTRLAFLQLNKQKKKAMHDSPIQHKKRGGSVLASLKTAMDRDRSLVCLYKNKEVMTYYPKKQNRQKQKKKLMSY